MVDMLLSPVIFAYIVLPCLIFCARICDVTLGTIRVIFISKGIKYIAPMIGFFEVIIGLLAIGQVMNNLTTLLRISRTGPALHPGHLSGC